MNGNTTHGHAGSKFKTKTYLAWVRIKGRCYNPKNKKYPIYGGRGIKVCKRWMKYENFLKDMGDCPDPKLSLDRIDVNGDYCKKNCRWATSKEQSNNRRACKYLEFNGKKMTYQQWAEELGFKYGEAIANRLKSGWSLEKTLTTCKAVSNRDSGGPSLTAL